MLFSAFQKTSFKLWISHWIATKVPLSLWVNMCTRDPLRFFLISMSFINGQKHCFVAVFLHCNFSLFFQPTNWLAFNYMFTFWFRIFTINFYFQSSQKTKSSFAKSSGLHYKEQIHFCDVHCLSCFILAIDHWNNKKKKGNWYCLGPGKRKVEMWGSKKYLLGKD